MTTPTKRAWLPQLRAIFVTFHILALCALATPDLGRALNRKAWQADTVQDELTAWAQRVSRLGSTVTPEQFEERVWSIASSWAAARETMLRPFTPYAAITGARQRWRMFAAPNRVPARLRIAVKAEGEWRTVYEARSTEYTWQEWRFDAERVRVVIHRASWRHRKADYKRLVDWIADEAARDFPEASHVRVSFVRARTPTPEQIRAGDVPEGKEERKAVRKLEPRR